MRRVEAHVGEDGGRRVRQLHLTVLLSLAVHQHLQTQTDPLRKLAFLVTWRGPEIKVRSLMNLVFVDSQVFLVTV